MLCVPVVKFVRGNLLTCAAEKIVLLRRERHIAEACELPRVEADPLQRARHRIASDFLGQVHKPAAFRDAGKAADDGFANRFAHGFVLRERFGVELGVAARKIEPLKVLRERFIFQRTEIDKLRAEPSEKRQTVFIEKAERLVPRNTDAHGRSRLWKLRRGEGKGRSAFCNFHQRVKIERLLRRPGQALHFFLEV